MEYDFEVDYCVIGAGAAGCVLADRLSESGRHEVAVIEAGPSDWHPYIHIPATFVKLVHDRRFAWRFDMEPEPGLGGRVLNIPQGKVLGGGSSINGMIFMRGQPAEYDEWAQKGCRGWSYDDVLPIFKRIESADRGEDAWRGRGGPVTVTSASEIHPLTRAFVEAGKQIGFAENHDFNGVERDGIGVIQNNRRGRFRAGTAQTYLARAKRRPNLRIETHALARRILFDGRRAIGMEFSRGDRVVRVRARREVIVSCGSIKTPHLLQLSGIGDATHLAEIGVPVVHDLPGVGRDLRDHLYVRMQHRVRGIRSMNEQSRGFALGWELARYALMGKGLMANAMTAGALFCRSRRELAAPDLYVSFLPGSNSEFLQLEHEPGMSIGVVQSHPESRGSIRARSSNPDNAPAIAPNYLSALEDRAAILAGLRIARRLFAAPALARYSARETLPGLEAQTDEALLDFARQRGTSGLHFTSSCRMGIDARAVVSPTLEVHGMEGLRIADGSVMPGCASGNTQAPILMIAEKCAEMILTAA